MRRTVLLALLLAALAPATAAADERPRITMLRLAANLPTEPVVSAVINPGAAATTWHVEYGYTTTFGSVTPDADYQCGTSVAPVRRTQLFFSARKTTSGNHTTTIKVRGTFWFYRPEPR